MPTPRSVRIVASGELADWPEPGPAAHLKLFLPDTPKGPVMRTYTVRDWDRVREAVTIDMSLNVGLGPATQWASRVVPGMRLDLSGRSRSTFVPAAANATYLFAGDESALPAIMTCLAALPMTAQATAVIEVADAAEEQPFDTHAVVNARWLHRTDPLSLVSAILEAARDVRPDVIWLACEASAMRSARRQLLDAGWSARALTTQAYWKRDEADHPDHDMAEEIL